MFSTFKDFIRPRVLLCDQFKYCEYPLENQISVRLNPGTYQRMDAHQKIAKFFKKCTNVLKTCLKIFLAWKAIYSVDEFLEENIVGDGANFENCPCYWQWSKLSGILYVWMESLWYGCQNISLVMTFATQF